MPGEEELAIERAAVEAAAEAAAAAEQMLKRFEQLQDMRHLATKRRRTLMQAAMAEAADAEAAEAVEGRKADVLLACPARRRLRMRKWPRRTRRLLRRKLLMLSGGMLAWPSSVWSR
ncbi:unnamed protein product, partial [Symbiodinium sp. CCMP2456]